MRKAFTLVELFVVIGVIVVVIALLLPALSRAREQAWRAQCLSNEHQLLVACAEYEVDCDSYLPWPNWLPLEAGGYRGPGWLYKYPNLTQQTDVQKGSLY